MDCSERRDLIFQYAAGALDADEQTELRLHLAGGCPQCAGAYAEAEAVLAMLPLALAGEQPPADLKRRILSQARPVRTNRWDRIVMPAAIAAVLAVAVTLLVVRQLLPANTSSTADQETIANLEKQLTATVTQLEETRESLRGMKFAQLTGDAQPGAVGHVFLDPSMNKWYFFTCGMKPAADGKTYTLWLICDGEKMPAGTFSVSQGGTATLLGSIPPLPPGAPVTLAVTDEPSGQAPQSPTGQMQIKGAVE